jgi:hypothetical protein
MGLSGGPSNVEYRTFLAIEKLRNRYFQKNKKSADSIAAPLVGIY